MFGLFAPIIVPSILKKGLKLQKELGYRLSFKDIPKEWISGYALADMTKTWKRYGLSISGLNYFTFGTVKNGLSTRFIKDADLYQAWLGGYIFSDSHPINWTPKDFIKLCEADQKKWLWYFGVKNPKMDFDEMLLIGDININAIRGKLYSWTGITQSDVGTRSKRLYNRAIMDGMAYIMNQLTPNLVLKGKYFIPDTKTNNEIVKIYGYMAVMNLGSNKKALIYICKSYNSKEDMSQMRDLISKHVELFEV